jgi:hypothetical protein
MPGNQEERRSLSDIDIERLADALAPKLVEDVRRTHHDFWIDAETHYMDHKRWQDFDSEEMYDLKNLVRMFRVTRGLWFRTFIGLAIVGTIAAMAFGMGFHK